MNKLLYNPFEGFFKKEEPIILLLKWRTMVINHRLHGGEEKFLVKAIKAYMEEAVPAYGVGKAFLKTMEAIDMIDNRLSEGKEVAGF